jgi:hypothetical protein
MPSPHKGKGFSAPRSLKPAVGEKSKGVPRGKLLKFLMRCHE